MIFPLSVKEIAPIFSQKASKLCVFLCKTKRLHGLTQDKSPPAVREDRAVERDVAEIEAAVG